jgi:hypothetical protein
LFIQANAQSSRIQVNPSLQEGGYGGGGVMEGEEANQTAGQPKTASAEPLL